MMEKSPLITEIDEFDPGMEDVQNLQKLSEAFVGCDRQRSILKSDNKELNDKVNEACEDFIHTKCQSEGFRAMYKENQDKINAAEQNIKAQENVLKEKK